MSSWDPRNLLRRTQVQEPQEEEEDLFGEEFEIGSDGEEPMSPAPEPTPAPAPAAAAAPKKPRAKAKGPPKPKAKAKAKTAAGVSASAVSKKKRPAKAKAASTKARAVAPSAVAPGEYVTPEAFLAKVCYRAGSHRTSPEVRSMLRQHYLKNMDAWLRVLYALAKSEGHSTIVIRNLEVATSVMAKKNQRTLLGDLNSDYTPIYDPIKKGQAAKADGAPAEEAAQA